jgi:hypothetical protein
MRYAQINSKYVCGIDLHAREMYACVMNEKGEILFHRNMRTDFDQFKKKMQPSYKKNFSQRRNSRNEKLLFFYPAILKFADKEQVRKFRRKMEFFRNF